ncbi:hypothetical protein NXX60_14935 [Bacteroides thetaiotaomicron]|nr:hypothetical protein NXX60_14935 [Bacteroides thetaiotaomicron]
MKGIYIGCMLLCIAAVRLGTDLRCYRTTKFMECRNKRNGNHDGQRHRLLRRACTAKTIMVTSATTTKPANYGVPVQ